MVHLQVINKKIILVQALTPSSTCSQNKNQLLFIHDEHLLFSGLQTVVVNSHKRVLLKLPVFTLFYVCIYETNSVYASMYVYTCGPLYVYTWYLLAASICMYGLQDDIAVVHTARRERFSTTICVPLRTSSTVLSGYTQMQPSSQHLMVKFPALSLSTSTEDRGTSQQ